MKCSCLPKAVRVYSMLMPVCHGKHASPKHGQNTISRTGLNNLRLLRTYLTFLLCVHESWRWYDVCPPICHNHQEQAYLNDTVGVKMDHRQKPSQNKGELTFKDDRLVKPPIASVNLNGASAKRLIVSSNYNKFDPSWFVFETTKARQDRGPPPLGRFKFGAQHLDCKITWHFCRRAHGLNVDPRSQPSAPIWPDRDE